MVSLDMKLVRPIHELSLQEQTELLQPVIDRVQQENLDNGLYNVYQDGSAKNHMIHDYLDHTEEVHVNAVTGRTRTVRRISK